MEVTAEKKKASPLVWMIVIIMVIALLALVIFYAYQDYPNEKLPTDGKKTESSKVIFYLEA